VRPTNSAFVLSMLREKGHLVVDASLLHADRTLNLQVVVLFDNKSERLGAPDQPRIMKVTKNTVDLSWVRPLQDGGSIASVDSNTHVQVLQFKDTLLMDWQKSKSMSSESLL
jgi:hypothetical protein